MFPRYARFLLKCWLYLSALLFGFRLLAACFVARNLGEVETSQIFAALRLGWRFDNVVVCAAMTPAFLLFTLEHFLVPRAHLRTAAIWTLRLLIPVVCALQTFDIFYFNHFGVRTTSVVLNWVDDLAFGLTMLTEEPAWLIGLVLGVPAAFLVARPVRVWARGLVPTPLVPRRQAAWAATSLLVAGLLFLGIRGRVALKSPIREGLAYFSDNPTLNQLALNPVFTFASSWVRARKYREKPLKFMPHSRAVEVFRAGAGLPPAQDLAVDAPGAGNDKPHMVVVMLEGMSAHYGKVRKSPSWTPVLDRLMDEGLSFPHAYSAGTHTFNGVWSTLFSFPTPYSVHPLKRDRVPKLGSLPAQLKAQGWQTLFFTTHDEEFDNMAGFLRQNGFSRVVAQDDYPPERVFSILGVPDHDMYLKALEVLDGAAAQGPFFAALLSGSNHRPYVIPPELKTRFGSRNEKENIVRYSDWAVGQLIEGARGKPWFKDAVFVFLADHGQAVGTGKLDQILSYHHMPLVFWGPGRIASPRVVNSPASQMDVMPTLLGFLGIDHRNATLGRDLLKRPRDWVYVVRDNAACSLTVSFLDCESQDGSRTRFPLDPTGWAARQPATADIWMQVHAELQLADEVLRSR